MRRHAHKIDHRAKNTQQSKTQSMSYKTHRNTGTREAYYTTRKNIIIRRDKIKRRRIRRRRTKQKKKDKGATRRRRLS